MNKTYIHPYHLVDPSPWPFLMGFAGFLLTSGLVCWMTGISTLVAQLGAALVL
jgi:heme/copper-type cytochrome/quinol oxidase subunit 3